MKKKILVLTMATMLTAAMLTGCGSSDTDEANTITPVVTKTPNSNESNNTPGTNETTEGGETTTPAVLTDEEKLAKELSSEIKIAVEKVYGKDLTGTNPDWEWIDSHFTNTDLKPLGNDSYVAWKDVWKEEFDNFKKENPDSTYRFDEYLGTQYTVDNINWDDVDLDEHPEQVELIKDKIDYIESKRELGEEIDCPKLEEKVESAYWVLIDGIGHFTKEFREDEAECNVHIFADVLKVDGEWMFHSLSIDGHSK